jgi:carbonic anhydrase
MALCFVASAESLLCAVATDKLHTGPRANLHRELIGQGVGNTISGLLGGLPITGVIVRSTANITAGAKTRLSAILHGVWVLLFVALLPGVISQVPLAALAGLLVYTGFKLMNPKQIRELAHHGELGVYLVTVVAIVSTNLLVGLGIGFGAALLRLLWKLTHVDVHVDQAEDRWTVYVDGTLTFTGVPKLMTRLATLPPGQHVTVDLNLGFIDHAGYEALNSWKDTYEKLGGKVDLSQLEGIRHRSERRELHREAVGSLA